MIERLAYLVPEVAIFFTTCVVMVMGLSPNPNVRKQCGLIGFLGLFIGLLLSISTTPTAPDPRAGQTLLPGLALYAKSVIAGVGLLLLPLMSGVVDRGEEAAIASGRRGFDALRTNRAEFHSFFLFSITGLMLCASAHDLVWLFLALELTSLPTYVMAAISVQTRRGSSRAQEAAVKYFFLGAFAAAVFLFGFALIYGGTGSTNLNRIHASLLVNGINPIAMAGIMLTLLGLCFKIAAVPMHFYTPDVYQGSATPVSAMLAFVPKTAGFLGIVLITACVGWRFGPEGAGTSLPEPIRLLLWVIAALTMTVGNVLAILQTSVKRLLAYSSIAHSGYMLVGVVAGPGDGGASITRNGLAAVLFYLLAYGVMNVGVFAALSALERRGSSGEIEEIDSFDAIRGLCRTRPWLGWTLVVCTLSLLGLPPLLGFFGKLPLFASAIGAGEVVLVVVLGLNSAIAAYYYLRLAGAALLEAPGSEAGSARLVPFPSRMAAGVASAIGVVTLAIFGNAALRASADAAAYHSEIRVAAPSVPSTAASPPAIASPHGARSEH